jgi:hypothetical protein
LKTWLTNNLIDDPREQTTAATDLLLAVGAYIAIWRLHGAPGWRRQVWQSAFGLLVGSSVLGAVVHSVRLSAASRERLWQPLNLLLGLMLALFATGAISDRWGRRAGQRVLPLLVIAARGCVWLSRRVQRGFLPFIIYEIPVMLTALMIYIDLARRRYFGARNITIGILITMLAAGIQTSSLALRIGKLPFDHNGLFHLVQLIAFPFLVEGVRAILAANPES